MDDTKEYEPGDIIGKFKPYVYCLQQDQFTERCETCFKLSTNLMKCSKCRFSQYCSKQCQIELWKFHKTECGYQTKYNTQIYPSFIFECIRLIKKLKTDKNENFSEIVFGKSRSLNDLISHVDKISKDKGKIATYRSFLLILNSLKFDTGLTPERIFELFCKLAINGIEIHDYTRSSIGMGLYIGGSVFNHSCNANAVTIFHGNELIVRALRKIKKGEEITTSYIQQMQPTHLRRQELLESYYFECLCEMCSNDLLTKEMSLFNCLEEAKNISYIDNTGTIVGDRCDHERCKDVLNGFKNLKNDQISGMETQALYKNLTKTYGCIDNQKNYYSYMYHQFAFELCSQLGKRQLAVDHGEELLKIMQKFLFGNHPAVALHLVIVGNMYANNNNLPKAIKLLQQGGDMLALIHGDDFENILQVDQTITECKNIEKENNNKSRR